MKFMVISLLFIISISFVTALEFDFNYPDDIVQDEEFKVTLGADALDSYDVKIFVTRDVKAESEIYNNEELMSTRYYIKEAFPDQKEFKLIAHNSGNTEICVRLRKSGQSSFDEKCKDIEIKVKNKEESNQVENDEKDDEKSEKESDLENQNAENEKMETNDNLEIQYSRNIPYFESLSNENKLILNDKQNTQQQEETQFSTKKEKTILYLALGFTVFTIIIIILLALKKM